MEPPLFFGRRPMLGCPPDSLRFGLSFDWRHGYRLAKAVMDRLLPFQTA
jgi:hypothetical protein